jgi:hypothetical protein
MELWILLIAVLVCPLVMGTAMLLMWRGMRGGGHSRESAEEPSPQPDESHARRA